MSSGAGSEFDLKIFVVGPMGANCYLVSDPQTKEACLIDPGADPEIIKGYIRREGLNLRFIINTHGHADHIGANGFFGVPIYIHALDKDFLADAELNLSAPFFLNITSPEASRLLDDGDEITLGKLKFGVVHTPGHTPGSISLLLGNAVFTGDTLFRSSVGRTDFEYGNEAALFQSISEKLLVLNDETVVYPGHGEKSTIKEELRSNPFFA